jgi:hypothetical protein
MKRFVTNSVLFLAIFFILEKPLILLRNHLPDRELDKRLEYIITGKMDADIVVMGSSRGARDIVASQLADSLYTTAYNLSFPGTNICFHEYLLAALLEHGNKKPKLLILAVDDPYEMEENHTLQFRFDDLYPLVKYKSIRNTLIEQGEKNRILTELFIIYQLSISNFDPRKQKFTYLDTLRSDGSMPISSQSPKFNRRFATGNVVYDKKKEEQSMIESFTNVLQMCQDNNITVLLACAPNFSKPTVGFKERMEELARNNSYVMQYDTTNPVYRNAEYYTDDSHLKLNGATIFTNEVAAFIKQNKILSR